MVIEIRLHTILQLETPSGKVRKVSMTLLPGATLAEVLAELRIELPLEGLLLVINGRLVDVDTAIADGDVIDLIPALSGGSVRSLSA